MRNRAPAGSSTAAKATSAPVNARSRATTRPASTASELETVIADHLDVVDVAVFAIPHERWGETPMAVCTVKEGATVSEQEITTLVADTLGSYKKPSRVELATDPLPKSPVDKLLRKQLRDPHWAGHDRRVGGG